MLHFRTILLFLAFILLLVQEFVLFDNLRLGIVFRLIPSALLIIWFMVSILSPKKYGIDTNKINKYILTALRFLRPLASISIITGAILKIMHWQYGNYFLIAGIGVLAIWSFLFSLVAFNQAEYNPEIIDDTNTED